MLPNSVLLNNYQDGTIPHRVDVVSKYCYGTELRWLSIHVAKRSISGHLPIAKLFSPNPAKQFLTLLEFLECILPVRTPIIRGKERRAEERELSLIHI